MPSQTPDHPAQHGDGSNSRLRGIGEALCGLIEQNETAVLTLSMLVLVAVTSSLSWLRPYTFDEILAMCIASQPDMHHFMVAMPADASPPLMDLLMRGSIHVLGPNNIAGRVPSILSFAAACFFVYLFVRRRCGISAAYLAMALLATEAGWSYAFEARPYAMLLAFTMLALLCWQRAAERREQRGLSLFGLAVAIAGAMLTQHLGVIQLGFPIFCGELWRLFRSRRPDWPLYATFLISLPVLMLTIPMVRNSQRALSVLHAEKVHRLSAWFMLHWLSMVFSSLHQIIGLGVLLLAVPVYVALKRWQRGVPVVPALPVPLTGLPEHETAAAAGAALLIPLTALVLFPVMLRYDCRYAIGTIAGVAILGAFGMYRLLPLHRGVQGIMLLVCGLFFLVNMAHSYAVIRPVIFPLFSGDEAHLPLETTEPFRFYPLWWYGTQGQRDRLYFIYEPGGPAGMEGVPVFERNKLPMKVMTYDEFLSNVHHFVSLSPPAVLIQRSTQLGFALTPIGATQGQNFDVKKQAPPPAPVSPVPGTAP